MAGFDADGIHASNASSLSLRFQYTAMAHKSIDPFTCHRLAVRLETDRTAIDHGHFELTGTLQGGTILCQGITSSPPTSSSSSSCSCMLSSSFSSLLVVVIGVVWHSS